MTCVLNCVLVMSQIICVTSYTVSPEVSKCVLPLSRNRYPLIPVGHSVHIKEMFSGNYRLQHVQMAGLCRFQNDKLHKSTPKRLYKTLLYSLVVE